MSVFVVEPRRLARRTRDVDYGERERLGFLRFSIVLYGPDGEAFDITSRTEARVGSLQQAVETDTLAEITHDDLDLDADDSDGMIESLLSGATRGDLWTLAIDRERNERGRRVWRRFFTGVVDLPDSLTFDRAERTAQIRVFSASKLLERVSAESVARLVTGRTGSVTATFSTVTVTSTTDLLPGDTITLDDGTNRESGVVLSITNATTLKTVDAWENTFASGSLLSLDTRFYRYRSPLFLLDELMQAASLSYDVQGFPRVNAAIPADINPAGLPRESGDKPDSVTIEAGKISIAYSVGSDTGRQVATDPASGFSAGSAATTTQGDWTPYLDSEPATIITAPAAVGRDNGFQAKPIAWDYVNGDYWHLEITSGATSFLRLYKNSVLNETVDSFAEANPAAQGYINVRIEHCPDTDELWISYARANGTGTNGLYYRATSAGPVTNMAGSLESNLRYVRGVGLLAQTLDLTSPIRLINAATHTYADKTWDRPPNSASDSSVAKIAVNLWSMRRIGRRLVASYRGNDAYEARIAVWSVDGGDVLSHFAYATGEEATWYDCVSTVYRWPDGEETYVICAGPASANVYHYFTVGYRVNAIAYADFEGMSVAAALRELCVLCNATVRTTAYGDIRVDSRWFYFGDEDNIGTSADLTLAMPLPEPLERETMPLSEYFAESVQVNGTSESGARIERIIGIEGASARRFTLDGALLTSVGMADAAGIQWYEFLSALESQESVTIELGSEPFVPLDVLSMDGRVYLAISVETDLESQEQDLTLLEI